MNLKDYIVETESFSRVCPNCSRGKEDFVECVDRYGREEIEVGEGVYCGRCGCPFETN